MISVTRRLEFDAGHRIPDHRSQCRNLHGHRYVLEITLTGDVVQAPGESDNGMLMDFSEIKQTPSSTSSTSGTTPSWSMRATPPRGFLDTLPGHKTVVLDRIPHGREPAAIVPGDAGAALSRPLWRRAAPDPRAPVRNAQLLGRSATADGRAPASIRAGAPPSRPASRLSIHGKPASDRPD